MKPRDARRYALLLSEPVGIEEPAHHPDVLAVGREHTKAQALEAHDGARVAQHLDLDDHRFLRADDADKRLAPFPEVLGTVNSGKRKPRDVASEAAHESRAGEAHAKIGRTVDRLEKPNIAQN